MLNPKLGLSAALLEINAWSGPLLFESNSDLLLLWYLGMHAVASLLLASFVQAFLPANRTRPRWATLLLLAGFSYAVPIAGFVCVLPAPCSCASTSCPRPAAVSNPCNCPISIRICARKACFAKPGCAPS